MTPPGPIVLILGSGPNAVDAKAWPKTRFDQIVSINNAWRVRPDWDFLIFPEDFPPDRRPADVSEQQVLVEADAFVPAQNAYGGFVFAGATMAFTAAYWALYTLQPAVMAFVGCDMQYPSAGPTHFYGKGAPDPLRDDVSLRCLEAKAARLAIIAANSGCACVNLSRGPSVLPYPRSEPAFLRKIRPNPFPFSAMDALRQREDALGYETPNGRYDVSGANMDTAALDLLDLHWLELFEASALQQAG